MKNKSFKRSFLQSGGIGVLTPVSPIETVLKTFFISGGLATVIYLDTLMAFVMVGGAAIMTFIGMKAFFFIEFSL